MPDPTYQSAPAGLLATLLVLRWGDPGWPAAYFTGEPEGGQLAVTDFGSAITAGLTYAPLEALEVRVRELQGGAEPDSFSVRLPAHVEPFRSCLDYGDPSIEAFVYECDPADAAATRRLIVRGEATGSRVHASGAPGVAEITFETIRARMRVAMGFEISPYCRWRFGDTECGKNIADYTFGDRLTYASGRTLKAAVLNTVPNVGGLDLSSSWARFGYVERGGLRIPITGHTGDTVTLRYAAPPHWLDRWVHFVAGCPKDKNACNEKFANGERFSGIGVATPTYSTIVGSGPS